MKSNSFKILFLIIFISSFNFLMIINLKGNINSAAIQDIEDSGNSLKKLDISQWVWSSISVISTFGTEDCYYPQIAGDSLGNMHVVWYDRNNYDNAEGDLDIIYRCWNATTTTWTTFEVVSTGSTGDSLRPVIAVDNDSNLHVAWYDQTNYGGSGDDWDIFYKSWNAITSSWTLTEVISTESTAASTSPSIAVDLAGNIHVAWDDETDYGGAGQFDYDIFYKFLNITTGSWQGKVTATDVISTVSTSASRFPTIAVDVGSNIHIAWVDNTNYLSAGSDADIFYRRWNATLGAWTTVEVLSPTPANDDSSWPAMAADNSGKIHLVWHELTYLGARSSYRNIIYRYLDSSSLTWSAKEDISASLMANSLYPTIAVDASENVHVAWQDESNYGSGGSDFDIFYKRWNATTSLWTTIGVLSTECDGSSNDPSIAVDATGYVHVTWDDRTNYHGAGTDRDIFYKKLAEPSSTGSPIPGFELSSMLLVLLTLIPLYTFFLKNFIQGKKRISSTRSLKK